MVWWRMETTPLTGSWIGGYEAVIVGHANPIIQAQI